MKTHIARGFAASVVLTALIFSSCAKKNDTPEAIKAGVIRDISKTFNIGAMDVTVSSVTFRDKEADATVTFSLKGTPVAQGMTMRYVMERHDDNQWYIKSRTSSAGAAGGTGGAMPAGHGAAMGGGDTAPMDGAVGGSGSKLNLPPGHPQLGQE